MKYLKNLFDYLTYYGNLSFDEYRGNSQPAEEDISKKIINRFIPFNEDSLPEDNNNTEA